MMIQVGLGLNILMGLFLEAPLRLFLLMDFVTLIGPNLVLGP